MKLSVFNREKSARAARPASLKGGGGRGGGGGGGGKTGGGGGGGKSSTGGTTSRGSGGFPIGGTSKTATSFSAGGGKYSRIPDGVVFAGRNIGGGTRAQVYGTPRYGSGYPAGPYGGGQFVGGRGFPFGFWPLYFGGVGFGPGYYGNHEYGPENNATRPGGQTATVTIRSAFWPNITTPSNSTQNSTMIPLTSFHLVGDMESVLEVLDVLVTSSCDVLNSTVIPYNGTDSSQPQPEQAVQYYRSSSFALTLDTYNNTAALPANSPTSNDSVPTNIPDSPIPTNGTDMNFLSCINNTIGDSVAIVDAAYSLHFGGEMHSKFGCITLLWLVLYLLG